MLLHLLNQGSDLLVKLVKPNYVFVRVDDQILGTCPRELMQRHLKEIWVYLRDEVAFSQLVYLHLALSNYDREIET